jgi:photosystem II stability/assembly factor-like uncharacterized protein
VAASGTQLFAGTNNGIFRSTNNGASWSPASNGVSYPVVTVFAIGGSSLFAGTPGGVYRSTDNGTGWTLINEGMQATPIYSMAASGTHQFVGTNSGGVFHSSDNGGSWSADNSGLNHRGAILTLLFQSNNLFAGTTSGIYRSSDNGANWAKVSTDTNIYSLAASGAWVVAGSYGGGIYRSSDNGTTWAQANTGLKNIVVTRLASTGTTLFAGTRGGGVFRSSDNGANWSEINNGMGPQTVIELATNGTSVVAVVPEVVYYSTDNGDSWTKATIEPEAFKGLIASGSNYYLGYRTGVMRSTDNGATWATYNKVGVVDNSGQMYHAKSSSWAGGGLPSPVAAMAVSGEKLYVATEGGGMWQRSVLEPASVGSHQQSASEMALYPNPATSSMALSYRLDMRTSVSVTMYDALGRIVSQPVIDAMQEAGEQQVALATDGLAAGVYLCSVNAGGVERTVRFMVTR